MTAQRLALYMHPRHDYCPPPSQAPPLPFPLCHSAYPSCLKMLRDMPCMRSWFCAFFPRRRFGTWLNAGWLSVHWRQNVTWWMCICRLCFSMLKTDDTFSKHRCRCNVACRMLKQQLCRGLRSSISHGQGACPPACPCLLTAVLGTSWRF